MNFLLKSSLQFKFLSKFSTYRGYRANFKSFQSDREWLLSLDLNQIEKDYKERGLCKIENIINEENVPVYQQLYSDFTEGQIDASKHRNDLGSFLERKDGKEALGQISWPSLFIENIFEGPLHRRSLLLCRALMGQDIEMDFDQLIFKAPYSNASFPWHQDEAYWLLAGMDFEDKRTLTCWTALDNTDIDNGCMQYVPDEDLKLYEHEPVRPGHHTLIATNCEQATFEKAIISEIKAGTCVFHNGRVLHQSGPNVSDRQRRAYIVNYRSKAMIQYERDNGLDHAKGGWENDPRGNAHNQDGQAQVIKEEKN